MEAKHRDILARDQFLDGLNNGHLRLRTRYGKPSSLEDAVRTAMEVQAAEAFEAQRSSPPKAEAFHSVNSVTTAEGSAIAALQRQMEMLTSAVQQLSRSNEQRSKPQTSGTTQFASRRCWNCGKYGHTVFVVHVLALVRTLNKTETVTRIPFRGHKNVGVG